MVEALLFKHKASWKEIHLNSVADMKKNDLKRNIIFTKKKKKKRKPRRGKRRKEKIFQNTPHPTTPNLVSDQSKWTLF
jgi:hypothetical protein